MAKAPTNLRGLKRKLIADPWEMPRRFRFRALEAEFWETSDFAPGVLPDGKSVDKEFDELLGSKEK